MSDERLSAATVTADDRLLDALGRGERTPDGDEVAAMLAAWRTDIDAEQPDAGEVAVVLPLSTRRVRRMSRVAVAAAAALVVGGGVTVAAASGANPDSPLWPITRVVFPERADVAAAQQAIDQAREAAAQGRTADARRLADEAQSLIGKVTSPQDAKRLQDALDEVRRMIAALPATTPGGVGTTPVPGVTPAPGAPATGGPGAGTGGNPGGNPGNPGGTKPGLPPLPTPSLPLPSLPLPSLPGLPIP